MSAQHIPKLVTVDEFEHIPNPPGGRYELHHGELVFVTYPVRRHGDLQRRLQELLAEQARPLGYMVAVEYPYCPLPQNEAWGADVACVRLPRHKAVERWLIGSPEMVIEVKSPSNTKHELDDKAMTTLAGDGALEFWIVDAKSETVKVYSRTSGVRIYRAPDEVPVDLFNFRLPVASIFADVD